MIRVLVVEDSPVVQEFLVHLLDADPSVQVVGVASNGEEALAAVVDKRPDVITMDVHMPKMNGLEATRKIMETHPTPIVVVSGSANFEEASLAFTAIEAGALAVVERPRGFDHSDHAAATARLIAMVRLIAEVPVVRRWARRDTQTHQSMPRQPSDAVPARRIEVVAIGASTGGPPVLHKILCALPADFPAPVLIVQHISPGFIESFADWLRRTAPLAINIARAGAAVLPGNVYLAPDGNHLGITSEGRLTLTNGPAENGHIPSVGHLFRAVTKAFGAHSAGVLLTGMGKDGAQELKLMRDAGAITIAQDKASSVIHGMPGEAIHLDAATYVISGDKLAAALTRLTNSNQGGLL